MQLPKLYPFLFQNLKDSLRAFFSFLLPLRSQSELQDLSVFFLLSLQAHDTKF